MLARQLARKDRSAEATWLFENMIRKNSAFKVRDVSLFPADGTWDLIAEGSVATSKFLSVRLESFVAFVSNSLKLTSIRHLMEYQQLVLAIAFWRSAKRRNGNRDHVRVHAFCVHV